MRFAQKFAKILSLRIDAVRISSDSVNNHHAPAALFILTVKPKMQALLILSTAESGWKSHSAYTESTQNDPSLGPVLRIRIR
jgi:hypothetical protein